MKNNQQNPNQQMDEKNKRRLLFIIVLVFMIVIVIIWGYGLKNKIDQIKQQSQKSKGLLKNTKNLWDEVFESNTSTQTIITSSTWNRIVSTTEMIANNTSTQTGMINTTTKSTTNATTIDSSTVDALKREIEKKKQ